MRGKLKRGGSAVKVTSKTTAKTATLPRSQPTEIFSEELTPPPPPLTAGAGSIPEPPPTASIPYQRLQQLLAYRPAPGRSRRTITTGEGLLEFLQGNTATERITLRMKLVWILEHTYRQSTLVRLYFTDANSAEPLQAQLELFRGNYEENKADVDTVLFTATIWDTDAENGMLPTSGSIVEIAEYSSLKLFCDKQCQANARLRDLIW
ncbi:hypothetical protein V7S43_013138 [Phytophthora oleae]|uniref:Uncharacterized protein n=1 Tax=Phytophthora oleae TaxID=2107226 RepID=A0ABD3F6F2_9STRA